MADNTDDLIISISTDTATIRRSLQRLVGDIGTTTNQIARQFDGVGKSVNSAMTTALQTRINDMVGIGQKAAKEWNGALADQGKQLDALRVKYNPLYATITQYKATVSEIKTAFALGAISSDEYTAALSRQRQAALANISAIKSQNAAQAGGDGHGSSLNGGQLQALLHSARSVTEQLALGVSPTQALVGQLSHLSYVASGPGGVSGALTGIGEALIGVVSEFPLVTAAAVAAAAGLAAYYALGKDKVPELDDILKVHKENIDRLGPAYQAVLDMQQKYVRDSPLLASAKAQAEGDDAMKRRVEDAASAYNEITKVIDIQKIAMAQAAQFDPSAANNYSFRPAQKEIDDFGQSIKNNAPKVREFQDAIAGLQTSGQITAEVAKQLLDFTKAAAATENSLSGVTGKVDPVGAAFQRVSDQMTNLPIGDMRSKLEELISGFQSGKVSAAEFSAQAQVLEQSYPTYSGWIQNLANVIESLQQATTAAKDLSSYVDVGSDIQKGGRNAALDQLRQRMQTTGADENFFIRTEGGSDLADKLKSQKKTYESDHRVRRTPATPKTADDRIDEDIQSIRDRSDALKQEISLVGLSYQEQEKRRTELDLEQKALKDLREEARRKGQTDLDDIKLSPERISQIQKEASAYAAQAEALRQVQESHEKAEQASSEFYDTFKSDAIDAIDGAKSLSDALGDIAKKLGDMLLNQAFDSLFKPATDTSSGGAFGGIFSSIGKWITSGFDAGGYTGSGGKYQPAGVVHKGEFVFDAEAVRRIGVDNLRKLQVGYASGGLVGGPRMPSASLRATNDNVHVTYAPQIDNRGADAAAVAKLQQRLDRDQAEFSAKVVSVVRTAKKTRQPGF